MTMMMTTTMTMMITIMTMFKTRVTTMMMTTMTIMMMMRGEEWITKEAKEGGKRRPCKPVKCQVKFARPFLLAGVTGR